MDIYRQLNNQIAYLASYFQEICQAERVTLMWSTEQEVRKCHKKMKRKSSSGRKNYYMRSFPMKLSRIMSIISCRTTGWRRERKTGHSWSGYTHKKLSEVYCLTFFTSIKSKWDISNIISIIIKIELTFHCFTYVQIITGTNIEEKHQRNKIS